MISFADVDDRRHCHVVLVMAIVEFVARYHKRTACDWKALTVAEVLERWILENDNLYVLFTLRY